MEAIHTTSPMIWDVAFYTQGVLTVIYPSGHPVVIGDVVRALITDVTERQHSVIATVTGTDENRRGGGGELTLYKVATEILDPVTDRHVDHHRLAPLPGVQQSRDRRSQRWALVWLECTFASASECELLARADGTRPEMQKVAIIEDDGSAD